MNQRPYWWVVPVKIGVVSYYFPTNSDYLNRIQAMARGAEPLWGVFFFVGAYFPQKSDLHPPIETQHVSE